MSENDRTNQAVYQALRSLGWVVPQSEQEVAEAARAQFIAPSSCPPPPANDVGSTLARAAREAGHLTPEIEQAMRRDRQAAEAELDQAPHGEDVG